MWAGSIVEDGQVGSVSVDEQEGDLKAAKAPGARVSARRAFPRKVSPPRAKNEIKGFHSRPQTSAHWRRNKPTPIPSRAKNLYP